MEPLRKEVEPIRGALMESRPSSISFEERGSAFVRLERARVALQISPLPPLYSFSHTFRSLHKVPTQTAATGKFAIPRQCRTETESAESQNLCSSSSCPPLRNTTQSVRPRPYAQTQSTVSTASSTSDGRLPYPITMAKPKVRHRIAPNCPIQSLWPNPELSLHCIAPICPIPLLWPNPKYGHCIAPICPILSLWPNPECGLHYVAPICPISSLRSRV
jgi:hypothetical protein